MIFFEKRKTLEHRILTSIVARMMEAADLQIKHDRTKSPAKKTVYLNKLEHNKKETAQLFLELETLDQETQGAKGADDEVPILEGRAS